MAMSLSADDEDYDSDSEQVSTPNPCRQAERGHQRNACTRQSSVQHHRAERKWSYLERNALIHSAALIPNRSVCYLFVFLSVCVCGHACVFSSGKNQQWEKAVFG